MPHIIRDNQSFYFVVSLIMDKKGFDIHKAGGIIIENKKLLVEKSFNKDFFIAPGGKVEKGETTKASLVRELMEEFSITVYEDDLQDFDVFYAQASGMEDKRIRMDVYVVNKYEGDIKPSREVEKVMWIDSNIPSQVKVGSIFEHEVIPRLKDMDIID